MGKEKQTDIALMEIGKRKMIGSISRIFSLLLMLSLTTASAFALTAEEVAQKTASLLTSAKGIEASFTITSNGRTAKGTVKTTGSKFAVATPQVSTWYNGKILYTYNPRINETTITTPTAQELMESNPLLYVNAGKGFKYSFSPVKRNGKYVVDLTPVSKKTGITKMTVTVNATTFHPEKINVTAGGGQTVVDITAFKTTSGLAASTFEYPKAKYPKAEVVDLR